MGWRKVTTPLVLQDRRYSKACHHKSTVSGICRISKYHKDLNTWKWHLQILLCKMHERILSALFSSEKTLAKTVTTFVSLKQKSAFSTSADSFFPLLSRRKLFSVSASLRNILRITSCYFVFCALTFLILSLHVCTGVLDLACWSSFLWLHSLKI